MILVVRVCIYTSSTDSNDIRHSRIHIDIHTCRTIEYTIVSRALRDTDWANLKPGFVGGIQFDHLCCAHGKSIDHCIYGVRGGVIYQISTLEVSPMAHNNVLFLKTTTTTKCHPITIVLVPPTHKISV